LARGYSEFRRKTFTLGAARFIFGRIKDRDTTWNVNHGKPTAKTPRTPRGSQTVGYSFSLTTISSFFLAGLASWRLARINLPSRERDKKKADEYRKVSGAYEFFNTTDIPGVFGDYDRHGEGQLVAR
jgi:hypothetical protein